MFGHADALALLGRCSSDPTCTTPAVTCDDNDPTVRRCARHAIEHLRQMELTR